MRSAWGYDMYPTARAQRREVLFVHILFPLGAERGACALVVRNTQESNGGNHNSELALAPTKAQENPRARGAAKVIPDKVYLGRQQIRRQLGQKHVLGKLG